MTTLADGTTITRVTGNLVVSWKNDITGKTIVRHLSGPTTTTVHPDGTGTAVGEGLNFWTFGPVSQTNTGEPGIVFTSGRAVIDFSGIFAESFFALRHSGQRLRAAGGISRARCSLSEAEVLAKVRFCSNTRIPVAGPVGFFSGLFAAVLLDRGQSDYLDTAALGRTTTIAEAGDRRRR